MSFDNTKKISDLMQEYFETYKKMLDTGDYVPESPTLSYIRTSLHSEMKKDINLISKNQALIRKEEQKDEDLRNRMLKRINKTSRKIDMVSYKGEILEEKKKFKESLEKFKEVYRGKKPPENIHTDKQEKQRLPGLFTLKRLVKKINRIESKTVLLKTKGEVIEAKKTYKLELKEFKREHCKRIPKKTTSDVIEYFVKNSGCDVCGKCSFYVPAKEGEEFTTCKHFKKDANKACVRGILKYFNSNQKEKKHVWKKRQK